ncbi:hypothetical protein VKT23_018397 [Stygiomarasmius scandens]|uniref:DNA 3'-5' helicase n=1 Tax=Marasmiellus scandens TaxID=2682957 RepID=A0ABR1IP16_9AGAR
MPPFQVTFQGEIHFPAQTADGRFHCICTWAQCQKLYSTFKGLKEHLKRAEKSLQAERSKIEKTVPISDSAPSEHDPGTLKDNDNITAGVPSGPPPDLDERELSTGTENHVAATQPKAVQTASDPYLSTLGLLVNNSIQRIICVDCGNVVPIEHVSAHVKDRHGLKCNQSQLHDAASRHGIPNGFPTIDHATPIAQVEGLPLYEGIPCSKCTKGFRDQRTLKAHLRGDHNINGAVPIPTSRIYMQQWNGGDHKTYFRVIPQSNPTSAVLDHVAEIRACIDQSADKLEQDLDKYALVEPFFYKNHWHHHIQNHSISELHCLGLPPKEEEFPGLRHSVDQALRTSISMISHVPRNILQHLNTTTPTKGISNSPFSAPVAEDSITSYIRPAICIIAFLLRPKVQYTLPPLPITIRNQIDDIKAKLATNKAVSEWRVLNLFNSLWSTEWIPTQDSPIADPTISWLILHSLNKNGAFIPVTSISPVLARIKFLMRLVFMRFMLVAQETSSWKASLEQYEDFFQERFKGSTFDIISSYSHQAASVALHTKSLPKGYWVDRSSFLHLLWKGDHIHWSAFKQMLAGMEEKLVSKFQQLTYGLSTELEFQSLTDDVSNHSVGFSFLVDFRNKRLLPKTDTLLAHLLADKELVHKVLQGCDADGKPIWNLQFLIRFLRDYANFQQLLLTRIEILAVGFRGSEITQTTFCNTQLRTRRNLYIIDNFVVLAGIYNKTSYLKGHDNLVPRALDAFTATLVLNDLIYLRPLAQFATYLVFPKDSPAQSLYKHMMFVNYGILFTSDDLSLAMQQWTEKYLSARIGLADLRHISVMFRREHCPSTVIDDDDLADMPTNQALLSGHSARTEDRVYAMTWEDLFSRSSHQFLNVMLSGCADFHVFAGAVPAGILLHFSKVRSASFSELAEQGLFSTTPSVLHHSNVEQVMNNMILKALQSLIPSLLQPVVDNAITAGFEKWMSKLAVINRNFDSSLLSTPQSLLLNVSQDNDLVVKPLDLNWPLTSAATEEFNTPPTLHSSVVTKSSLISHKGKGKCVLPPPALHANDINNDDFVEERLLDVLVDLLPMHSRAWKSDEQRHAAEVIYACTSDVLLVMATGGGKTITVILPALLEDKFTIIVVPLLSLLQDYKRRLNAMNVSYQVYDGNPNELHESSNLILSTIDMAQTSEFRSAIAILHEGVKPVARVVIDEAHSALVGHTYRKRMEAVYNLRLVECAMVCLTGTCPIELQDSLVHAYSLHDPLVMRSSTDRPELRYSVKNCDGMDHVKEMVLLILNERSHYLNAPGKAIIFVTTLNQGVAIRSMVQGQTPHKCAEFYHGGLGPEEREKIYSDWFTILDEGHAVLIATNALSSGNDYPHVRFVIHAGTPFDFSEWQQSNCRAGRDGVKAFCYTLTHLRRPLPQKLRHEPDPRGVVQLDRLLFDQDFDCGRYEITAYFDGLRQAVKCTNVALRCWRCKERQNETRPLSPPNPPSPKHKSDDEDSDSDSDSNSDSHAPVYRPQATTLPTTTHSTASTYGNASISNGQKIDKPVVLAPDTQDFDVPVITSVTNNLHSDNQSLGKRRQSHAYEAHERVVRRRTEDHQDADHYLDNFPPQAIMIFEIALWFPHTSLEGQRILKWLLISQNPFAIMVATSKSAGVAMFHSAMINFTHHSPRTSMVVYMLIDC